MAEKSPITESLRDLLRQADFYAMKAYVNSGLKPYLKNKVIAATDPWSDVMYQSLYLRDTDPDNRVILQEPAVKDPMVGVMVLKAARLSGDSGMVYCGTEEQLKSFAAKLPEYEERGEELNEKEFLECLLDAAEAEGLKVVFHRLSPEHGGEEEDEDYG